jgi:hypothetical protein
MSRTRDWYFISTIFLLLAICYYGATIVTIAISVNAGRAAQLASADARSQYLANQVLKTPTGPAFDSLQTEIAALNRDRADLVSQVNFGKSDLWNIPSLPCFYRPAPNCFHRSSSEMNLMLLGVFSGLLGASLLILVAIRTDLLAAQPVLTGSRVFVSFICLIPIGVIMGLLALFLMRGTQGTLVAPVSSFVQIDNPYGVAFGCTIAAFFSDRILVGLSKLVDHFGLGQDARGGN